MCANNRRRLFRDTGTLLLATLAALGARLPTASAHPVPTGAHLRTIEVRVRPTELAIHYRLEVEQYTAVIVDSKDLIDAAELRRLKTPSEIYDTLTRRLGPLLADQLTVTWNGQPLPLRCVEQRFEVLDHLCCDFIFQADWSPKAGTEQTIEVRDHTYEREPGRVRLSLAEDAAINVTRRTVASGLLQARAPTDLRPGDDERLRRLSATFQLAEATTPVSPRPGSSRGALAPQKSSAPFEDSGRGAPENSGKGFASSELLKLLDSPHGFGIVLLLAAAFGAAHALTPGHGKTLVAAYLVGERGTVWHALILGLTTTLTHTGAVIILAAGLLWWFPHGAQVEVQAALGFVSGLLIAGLGAWLFLRRLAGGADHVHVGGVGHTHNPDGSITIIDNKDAGWGRLILLGVSGGIVPCWDAIAMLGFTIAAGQLWLGVPLLLAFSAGLAGVLVAIGIAVVYAKGKVGARWADSRLWRILPIVSAAVLVVIGLWLCHDSIQPPQG
jgi:ABC-type nickel/cobalt efflux system permease component RcnA